MSLSLPAVALLGLAGAAHAQGFETHHPVVPSAGIAAEDGPGSLWVNPANLAYDPDPRYALYFSRGPGELPPASLALTAGAGGLQLGVHNLVTSDGDRTRSDWSLDYGTSIALPKRFAVGLLLSWNLVDGGTNYVAYDGGLSWRPLPWVGFSALAQNIGSPDPNGELAALDPRPLARPRTGGGVALRPFGDLLTLGVDYARLFTPDGVVLPDDDVLAGTFRLRPAEGLYLRGGVDAALGADGSVSVVQAGVGVEVYLGGIGAGYHQAMAADGGAIGTRTGWLGTGDPGESFVRTGRRVPELALDEAPPYEPRITLLSLDPGPSWLEVLERMRRLERDRSVDGLVLTLDGAPMSWARHRELRERVEALEAAGKPVLVYLRGSPSNGAYYVATAASQVVLHPAGDLSLVGLSAELQHLRGTLELVGVEPQFVRRDRYKSAPESWTRTEPSEANLEQQNALLDDLFDELVGAIAAGRQLEPQQVRSLVDEGPYTAEAAVEAGLVDGLAYPDEIEGRLGALHGGDVQVSSLLRVPQPHSAWEEPSQIALVYVDGVIVPGESSSGGLLGPKTVGADTIVRALDRAGEDPLVRAVVLRVDSPGGSAFASDEIWRAVERLRRQGKPVVASMGGVAASGGYYVAAGADAIWAQPNTITGSIGVFSGKMVTAELLGDVGIDTTVLVRGRNADLFSASRRWDDLQRAKMQEMVDETYLQFKSRVSDGRGMTLDEVDAVAGGRIWSGDSAAEVGLVDELGGLQAAIDDARRRAGIPDGRKVGLVSYSSTGTALEALAPGIVGRAARQLVLPRDDRQDLARLGTLLEPVSERLLWTLYADEHLWLLDPDMLEVSAE